MSNTKRLAFITGASSGLGQHMAQEFARRGYRLALVARRTDEIHKWVTQAGIAADRVGVYAADVSQSGSIVAAGERCIVEMGLPDVVVANAGISVGMDTAERSDLDVMAQTFALNNTGLAATFHPFARAMCARGSGRLVGVASVAGIRGLPGHGAYCASKAGVIAYCESLRGEMRALTHTHPAGGVKVVTIVPGYVATPLTAGNRYSMPFLMQPGEFAQSAVDAIEAGSSYRVIPWQMGVVAKLLRLLPNAALDRILAGRGRKKRAGEG